MSQNELDKKMETAKPFLRMTLPFIDAMGGLEGMVVGMKPFFNESIKTFLEKKKVEHAEKLEKGGFNSMSLSFISYKNQTGVMIFALGFSKDSKIPKITEPLEIIETKDFLKLLVSAMPLEELKKEL